MPGPSASKATTLWRYTNLFIIIIIIFDPGTQFPGNEKITLCNTKKLLLLFFKPTSTKPQAGKLG